MMTEVYPRNDDDDEHCSHHPFHHHHPHHHKVIITIIIMSRHDTFWHCLHIHTMSLLLNWYWQTCLGARLQRYRTRSSGSAVRYASLLLVVGLAMILLVFLLVVRFCMNNRRVKYWWVSSRLVSSFFSTHFMNFPICFRKVDSFIVYLYLYPRDDLICRWWMRWWWSKYTLKLLYDLRVWSMKMYVLDEVRVDE
jgi:hypothetical protein